MPSDSNGIFSLTPGYLAILGETIEPSQHNPPLEDIATALTARLMRDGRAPMTGDLKMGGNNILNAKNVTATERFNFAAAVDVASDATADIASAASNAIRIAAQDRDLKAQQEQASAYQQRAAEAERLADLTRKQIDDIKADEAARPAGACVYDDARARRLLDIGRTKRR